MSNQRNARRRPMTEEEKALIDILRRVKWREGSLDASFVAQLARKSVISEKQSRRMVRMGVELSQLGKR